MDGETIAGMSAWRDSTAFDASDRLVLEFTEALTLHNTVDDDLYARLAEAFEVPALARLAMTIGLAGMVNRIHAAFHTDVDEVTQQRLAR